jgi:hypothetical protein
MSPAPVTLRANKKIAETECLLCKNGFQLGEEVYSCATCGGNHHVGCSHPVEPAAEPAAPSLAADERNCPHCGQAIKREALKCRFCEKVIDSRLQAEQDHARQVKPPRMPWLLLLILHICTYGVFGLIWFVRQAVWAWKAQPGNKAVIWLSAGFAVLLIGGMVSVTPDAKDIQPLFTILFAILYQVANFSIKGAMETYYNSVEPIGLSLSGGMSFFFSFVYYQFHFSRIAREKKQGLTSLSLS